MTDVGPEALGWLTVQEVASRLKLSVNTVRRRIYAGDLEAIKDGALVRVTPQALAAYEEQRARVAESHASRASGPTAA